MISDEKIEDVVKTLLDALDDEYLMHEMGLYKGLIFTLQVTRGQVSLSKKASYKKTNTQLVSLVKGPVKCEHKWQEILALPAFSEELISGKRCNINRLRHTLLQMKERGAINFNEVGVGVQAQINAAFEKTLPCRMVFRQKGDELPSGFRLCEIL